MRAKFVKSLFVPKSKEQIMNEFKNLFLHKLFRLIETGKIYYVYNVINRDDEYDILILIQPLFNDRIMLGVTSGGFLDNYVQLNNEDIKKLIHKYKKDEKIIFLKNSIRT